jgi:hypothetical protein
MGMISPSGSARVAPFGDIEPAPSVSMFFQPINKSDVSYTQAKAYAVLNLRPE